MVRLTKYAFVLSLPILACQLAYGDESEPANSSSDGLSSAQVYAFSQDDQGFMWMGTRNGLDRYDGYEFRNYRHNPDSNDSLSSNDIRVVVATANGIIWAGSHAAGLDRFDSKTGTATNFRNSPGGLRDIGSDHVSAITKDFAGDIWVGTRGGGLTYIEVGNLRMKRFHTAADGMERIPSDNILSIFEDDAGRIWVGTDEGLIVTRNRHSGFSRAVLDVPESSGSHLVISIQQNSEGKLFLATSDGLLLRLTLDDDGSVSSTELVLDSEPIAFGNASTLLMDRHDRLWMTSRTRLLYDTLTGEISYASDGLTNYYEDRLGVIWGARAPGFSRFDPANLVFGDFLDDANLRNRSGSIEPMFAMLETDDGAIWMSSVDGVWRHEPGSKKNTHYAFETWNGLDPNDTNALYEDLHGIIWGGTYTTGINRIDPVSGQISSYHLCEIAADTALCNRVWAIHGDEQGNLWAGSADRLVFLDRKTDSFIPINVPAGAQQTMIASGVRALALDNNGSLWIGTQSGLVRWQRENDGWSYLVNDPANEESLGSNYINSLHADDDGSLWIATQLGAHRLDLESGAIERINTSTGLPNDDIHSVVEDIYGTIWMSTGDGLVSFDKDSGQIRILGEDDGLSSEEFLLAAGYAGKSGNVYFSGENGVVYFDPKMLTTSDSRPQVALIELRINNEIIVPDNTDPAAILQSPVNLARSITLPYDRSSVAVDFVALDYSDPSQIDYAYRLVGYDDDWIFTDSSRRVASYTNLPFGDYVLRVKAANKNGIWSEIAQSLKITVLTPFWRTWWAYLLYSITFVLVFNLMIRLRTSTLENRAASLEKAVDDRTRQIRDNEQQIRSQADHLEKLLGLKEKLFTNISHEFRTPLTLILGPVNRVLQSGVTDKQASNLQLAKENGQRLLRLVDQLLDLSRMDAEKPIARTPQPMSDIVAAIAESFRPIAKSKKIDFETAESENLWVAASADALEKVLMNLLSNAFKYTPMRGNISMSLTAIDDDRVSLVISDSGVGIPVEKQQAVFERFQRMDDAGERAPGAGIGLALVKDLVEALDGSVDLTSVPGEGTTVTVVFHRIMSPVPQSETVREIALTDSTALALETLTHPNFIADESDHEPEHIAPAILIIEDNQSMQQYLVELLSQNYACTVAGDGAQGLEMGLEQQPDLILCDVMLPRMDGYQVSQSLKRDERTSHIPIVMLTARGDHESRLLGLKEKVDDYLAKPFDDEELLLRIRNILSAREALRKSLAKQIFKGHVKTAELNSMEERFASKLSEIIQDNYSDPHFRIEQLSSEMAMSERPLQRKLKSLTGYTPSQYLRKFRLRRAVEILPAGTPVNVVAEAVGFSSPAYFASCFKEEFGVSPTQYAAELSHRKSNVDESANP
jgi:signal transduction histidine kinase/ligand-binding sensor domain-containing protein/DNA-binding response OmpR family regulator